MNKKFKHILILFFLLSFLLSSSITKSAFMPGWGEMNEFKILAKNNDSQKIKYIEKRSNALMLTEAALWLGFFLSNDFSKSYRDDYENYGTLYANVNWNGKNDLFASHVGNYNSIEEYNSYVEQIFAPEKRYEGDEFHWDWNHNKTLRLEYDNMRNKSGQLDEVKDLMIAALAINRIISVFDVIMIKRKHNESFSIDVYEDNNDKGLGLKINYHF